MELYIIIIIIIIVGKEIKFPYQEGLLCYQGAVISPSVSMVLLECYTLRYLKSYTSHVEFTHELDLCT